MTTDDPWVDPQTFRWLDNVRDTLIPALERSAVSCALITGHSTDGDIKQAVELGLSLLMGKPLILAVQPGTTVPPGLARAADTVIELDPDDPSGTGQRIRAAARALTGEGS